MYKILNNNLSNNKNCKKKKLNQKKIEFDEYNLVINTDNLSILTKKFFNKKIVKSYNSLAYTSIISHKKILNDVAVQIFTKKGPLAFLPISKNQTSIVYSIHNSKNNFKKNINQLIHRIT